VLTILICWAEQHRAEPVILTPTAPDIQRTSQAPVFVETLTPTITAVADPLSTDIPTLESVEETPSETPTTEAIQSTAAVPIEALSTPESEIITMIEGSE
jgi:hypothetical protein